MGISFGKFAETDNLVDSQWNIKAPNFQGTSTNATNVNVLQTNPTSNTTYYVPFTSGQSGNQRPRANDGLRFSTLQGTTSAVGSQVLMVGNNIKSGTNGNKSGYVRIFGNNTGYTQLQAPNTTGTYTNTLPSANGTIMVYKSLYENATGTTGNVTLSETCANFTYLQIFSRRGSDSITQWCSWVWSPNGKTFQIGGPRNGANGDGVWYFAKQVKANGTTLEVSYSKFAGITNTLQVQFGNDTSHYIVKVLGWK